MGTMVLKYSEGGTRIWRSPEGKWLGLMVLRLPHGGTLELAATASEEAIALALRSSLVQALHRLSHEYAKNPAAAGNIFGDVFRRVKKIGRGLGQTVSNVAQLKIKKALQSAARTALETSRLAGPASAFVPGAAQLAAAQRFLSAAHRGAPRARAHVRAITAAARRGDARARRIALLLAQAAQLMSQGGSTAAGCAPPPGGTVAGAAIGRWARGADGREIFIPDAQASGPGFDYLVDQLRPHLGYRRDTADVLTRRKAYRRGLEALATRGH